MPTSSRSETTRSESTHPHEAHAPHVTNHNKMGVWGAVSFVVGNVVGSGLFITPTSILQKTESVRNLYRT